MSIDTAFAFWLGMLLGLGLAGIMWGSGLGR